MVITEEEASKIKEHLLKQLDNFPEEKRGQIEKQIKSMSTNQVEEFIKQNNLTHLGGQCLFCAIVAGKTKSYKVDSNSENIAILDINPLSKGHILIIPKEHVEKIKETTGHLAQQVASRLKDKFNPESIKLNEIEVMGHATLEVIPVYDNKPQTRKQATEEELKELQEKIKELKQIEIKKEKKETQIEKREDIPVLPPRIP